MFRRPASPGASVDANPGDPAVVVRVAEQLHGAVRVLDGFGFPDERAARVIFGFRHQVPRIGQT